MDKTLTIKKRFMGPPGMGNGGYISGLLAAHLNNVARITLRQPTPLETPLRLINQEPDTLQLYAGERLIAEAVPDTVHIEIPRPPFIGDVLAAQRLSDYGQDHPFPHCFVCGPERSRGDGLCLFPVPVPGQTASMVAAVWEPDISLADENGRIQSEFMWAALDCPGGIAATVEQSAPIVLGQISGQVFPRVRVGERCVVIGWLMEQNGRKHIAGSALFTESGDLVGFARSTWIEPKPAA